jgi:hypothetical protein
MKSFAVPLTSGVKMTFFIGGGHLAVTESKKEPGTCTIHDGLHNNGGWSVALPADDVVKLIRQVTYESC